MAKEKLQPGVSLHGKSFRYRMRLMDEGVKRTATYKRYAFVEGKAAKDLPPDHPLLRANALAQANTLSIMDRNSRKTPQRASGLQDPEGTLLEWLIRYQVEALELRKYNAAELTLLLDHIRAQIENTDKKLMKGEKRGKVPPLDVVPERLAFHVEPRKSAEHDKSQIRSIIRLSDNEVEIADMLHSHVASLGPQHIHKLLALWSNGKAKPNTKRRLLNTLSCAWNHHAEFYNMHPPRPWDSVKIPGDGEKEKKRALTKDELKKIDEQLSRLHPTVRGAIEFLRWTGARRGEAANLRWESILWKAEKGSLPSVHFQRTKAARGVYKARFTYLEPELIAALARMVLPTDKDGNQTAADPESFDWQSFKWPKTGWVFPAPQSPKDPISGWTVYQAFVRSVEYAGVAHASPHQLRHTKATTLTATVPQAVAQELLGHDDAASFAIYRHLAEEAGYMVRNKTGLLVSAESLKTQEDIATALRQLPKEQRAALFASLMGGD